LGSLRTPAARGVQSANGATAKENDDLKSPLDLVNYGDFPNYLFVRAKLPEQPP
jgi:hypothetical protein